eukprot:COSAG06_NODE_3160_length_5756_cov_2.071946_1_plen_196_part_00
MQEPENRVKIAGLCAAVLSSSYEVMKNFQGQKARPDLKAFMSSGLLGMLLQMLGAFASADVDGLQDTDHGVLNYVIMLLSRCSSHPDCEAKIRGVASELAFCLEHSLDFAEEVGTTSASYAGRICCSVFGRDEISEFTFTAEHVAMLVEGWSQSVCAVGIRVNSPPTADTIFAAQLCVSDQVSNSVSVDCAVPPV